MSAFDRIIGYEQIKEELKQVADVLKNHEVYKGLGVSSPKGLLLEGEPGVGKTRMAQCLIEESGRKAYVCRKNDPDGEFVKSIKKTFRTASENEPSIVYLDDIDKFSNTDERHRNSEEFVTIQACIDELSGKEVFVLATANETDCLPMSLTRAGRFDRIIEVEPPEDEDAVRIIDHYIQNKKLAFDVDVPTVAAILGGNSCAVLETVINEAGINAGYKRCECITTEHIVEACMSVLYDFDSTPLKNSVIDISNDGIESQIVWHEAGHAVINEVLVPGCIVLATARKRRGSSSGFTKTHISHEFEKSNDLMFLRKVRIISSLGGRAAVETRFGLFDSGSLSDLKASSHMAYDLFDDLGYGGFASLSLGYCGFSPRMGTTSESESKMAQKETMTAALLEDFYRKAKEILAKNRDFLEKVAAALAEKDYLLASDIAAIRESCSIVNVAV